MSASLGLQRRVHHLHDRRRQPRLGRRGTKSAGSHRCSRLASKSYQAATTTVRLSSSTHSWERHSSHTSDHTLLPRHAGGETNQIWQVSSTFCWEFAVRWRRRRLLFFFQPSAVAVTLRADNFRFLHSEWHVNKSAHLSQPSQQHSLNPVTQNPNNDWKTLHIR